MPATVVEPLRAANALTGLAEEALYEIIDGQYVELPPMSVYASLVASSLTGELSVFSHTHPIGRPFAQMLYRLPLNVSRSRRPDVSFVTYERWPKNRGICVTDDAWDVVPDLAVEDTLA